ncbi:LysR family transcriptional regulator [Roseomonas chloroacetimidivorans]|uniref:LysR family transcriptional regulator n=1 Tax=Roseomonas chloroacetimidivorans TaxID=1766656 RepID=UPI003C7379EF
MRRRVTLRQIEAFVTVAREGSFTSAARSLGMSQSALTLNVQALEEETGLALFDRTTRRVIPTAQALEFLPTAERLLEDLDRGLDDITAAAARRRGSVVIAAAGSFIIHVLAPALVELGRIYPGIEVRLIDEGVENVTSRLLAGEIDFGITTLAQPARDLDAEVLLRDVFGVVCRKDSPLGASTAPLRWSAVANETYVAMSAHNGLRRQLDQNRTIARNLPRARYEVSSAACMQSLVENGAGVTILPALTAEPITSRSNLVFRPLTPVLRRELSVLKRSGRSLTPAAREVARHMLDALGRLRVKGLEVSSSPGMLALLSLDGRS